MLFRSYRGDGDSESEMSECSRISSERDESESGSEPGSEPGSESESESESESNRYTDTCWDTSDSEDYDSEEDYTDDVVHLEQMISLLGRIPKHIALSNREFFNQRGQLKHPYNANLYIPSCPISDSIYTLMDEYRDVQSETAQDRRILHTFCELLSNTLWYSPERRQTPHQLLNHALYTCHSA